MKQYVFSCDLKPTVNKEYTIQATGMFDAMVQVRKLKDELEADAQSRVNIKLKEIIYREKIGQE